MVSDKELFGLIIMGYPAMAEQWLSIVEYARATGISDMTIRRRIRTGKIKAELKDGKYFIPLAVDHATGAVIVNKQPQQSYSSHPVKNHPNPGRPVERSLPIIRRAEDEMYLASDAHVSPAHIPSSRPQQSTHSNLTQNITAWSSLPGNLTNPLVDAGLASVEARALIEFCDRALEQAKTTVESVEGKYGARLESLSANLRNKDHEIKALNQQIEDLQLLVQILERKKIG